MSTTFQLRDWVTIQLDPKWPNATLFDGHLGWVSQTKEHPGVPVQYFVRTEHKAEYTGIWLTANEMRLAPPSVKKEENPIMTTAAPLVEFSPQFLMGLGEFVESLGYSLDGFNGNPDIKSKITELQFVITNGEGDAKITAEIVTDEPDENGESAYVVLFHEVEDV